MRKTTSFAVAAVRATSLVGGLLLIAGCSSSVPEPEEPSTELGEPSAEMAELQARVAKAKAKRDKRAKQAKLARGAIPAECANTDDDGCLPPQQWVNKLCNGVYPEVALHMFRGGTPWTRVFSKARAPALNAASGGTSLSDEKVDMHEELIALRRNDDARKMRAGEMSMGDIAGYDFLRWNGSCVTLHDGEFSAKQPRRVSHARVEWKWLSESTQEALSTDGDVREAFLERRKECRGATMGRVSKECVKRDKYLMDAIVEYVRSGGELPAPSEMP
jgi:hypothetical protein